MSVNTWERDLSKIMFLWQSHLLNQYISYTFAHMPAKYKNSYDAYVINKGFESFENLYEANRIIVNENTPDADFKERKKLLRKGIGLLNACASAAHIYMDHVRKADGINEEDAILLDANDIKKLLAEKYHVPESNVIKSQYSYTIIKEESENTNE